MIYNYNGVNVYYTFFNKKSRNPIILLHGWGSNCEIFNEIVKSFPDKSFLAVDFPPFGKSDSVVEGWGIFTYVSMLISLCEHLGIEQCNLVGHSFGGRVAIIFSAIKCTDVQSCVLIDSAGMKPKYSIKRQFKIIKYKLKKYFGKSVENMGSKDYLALSPEMRKTFINIVNTFLEGYCEMITAKTMIIWGENDTETPIYMAKKLNKKIRNSRLEILNDAGHFSFLDCPLQTYRLLKEFWEEIWYM